MKKVQIYKDGACSGNPGPGGFGAILVCGTYEKELSGGEVSTTNNRMELLAVVTALQALKEPCDVTLTSDSTYVVHAVNKGWLWNWERKDFMRTKTQPIPNAELWRQLLAVMQLHTVRFVWVRGHNGHPYNERCDQLAVAAARRISGAAVTEGVL